MVLLWCISLLSIYPWSLPFRALTAWAKPTHIDQTHNTGRGGTQRGKASMGYTSISTPLHTFELPYSLSGSSTVTFSSETTDNTLGSRNNAYSKSRATFLLASVMPISSARVGHVDPPSLRWTPTLHSAGRLVVVLLRITDNTKYHLSCASSFSKIYTLVYPPVAGWKSFNQYGQWCCSVLGNIFSQLSWSCRVYVTIRNKLLITLQRRASTSCWVTFCCGFSKCFTGGKVKLLHIVIAFGMVNIKSNLLRGGEGGRCQVAKEYQGPFRLACLLLLRKWCGNLWCQ